MTEEPRGADGDPPAPAASDAATVAPRPARRVLRAVVIGVIALAVLVLLFTVVFPWVETLTDDPTLGG